MKWDWDDRLGLLGNIMVHLMGWMILVMAFAVTTTGFLALCLILLNLAKRNLWRFML